MDGRSWLLDLVGQNAGLTKWRVTGEARVSVVKFELALSLFEVTLLVL